MKSDSTSELLQAILLATPTQKEAALRVLRGEIPESGDQKPEDRGPEPYLTLREVGRRWRCEGVRGCQGSH